jgi:predicted DCC family thiol-disulfide oxidoreductase YuxK
VASTDTPSSRTDRPLVLYDEDCGFCRWTLAKLLAWDRAGRLRPLPIGSAEGRLLLADLSEERRQASWHFVDEEGNRSSAGSAAPPLLRLLPGGRAPAALMERFPRATGRAYAWVARNRSIFGRPLTAGAKRRADARIRRREAA